MPQPCSSSPALEPPLLERILDRLQIAPSPVDPTLENLHQLYAAWCTQVPFDNVQKLIHVRSGHAGPLPGSMAAGFFHDWLAHGTGGTCWAGAGALQALLVTLGFEAERGIATMLAAPHLPPNHATVRVHIEGQNYLLDTAMLYAIPLPMREGKTTAIHHPSWGLRCEHLSDGRWMVHWLPLHQPDGFDCRIESFGASLQRYQDQYESTRAWSPFNYQLYARRNRDGEAMGFAFGKAIKLDRDGHVIETQANDALRRRVLIEDFGMSEEIVSRLPADVKTPPPPGSRTAEEASL